MASSCGQKGGHVRKWLYTGGWLLILLFLCHSHNPRTDGRLDLHSHARVVSKRLWCFIVAETDCVDGWDQQVTWRCVCSYHRLCEYLWRLLSVLRDLFVLLWCQRRPELRAQCVLSWLITALWGCHGNHRRIPPTTDLFLDIGYSLFLDFINQPAPDWEWLYMKTQFYPH